MITNRTTKRFKLPENSSLFKRRLLVWASKNNTLSFLDSCDFPQDRFKWILALGEEQSCYADYQPLLQLSRFAQQTKDWLFGFFTYDLKNEIEPSLNSNRFDGLRFPSLCFFQPKKLIRLEYEELIFEYLPAYAEDIESDYQTICSVPIPTLESPQVIMKPRITKQLYFEKFEKLQRLLHVGDVFQVNFCQEFYSEQVNIDPVAVYLRLNELSPAPFSCFYRFYDHYALSSSPERFMKKEGNKLSSEPVKGTIKRSPNFKKDMILLNQLRTSEKDLAENTMIVDLVRNDLSKVALDGTVTVDQLCAIRSLNQVYQMFSEISCKLPESLTFKKLLSSLFPMGSMTGAPKYRCMEIIEDLEETKRGLYSGSMGYVAPNGDFDFNVVIRTMLYNQQYRYLSASVGGGITVQSKAESEYQECLLKLKAIQKVLN